MSQSVRSVRCVLMLTGILALASGCSHPLVVKNIDAYRVSGTMAQATKKSIGVVPSSANYNDQVILNGVSDSLRRYASTVVTPYAKGGDNKVDIVANIDLRSQYDGSGINFLIDWPGFLIWTPAWNGYVYSIKHNFSIRLEDGKSDTTLDTFNIPVDLNIRHAAMNRTWLAESGWWLLWSAPALIGGIMHTEYDPNVTPLEAREVAAPLGDFVAQEIVRRIPSGKTKATIEEKAPSSDLESLPATPGVTGETIVTAERPPTDEPKTTAEPTSTLATSLRELSKLKDDGLITQEEYDAKKKSLLEKY